MNKKTFNTIGWLILLGMTITWILYGYTNWFLLFLPIATICFSIHDSSIKEWKIVKRFSFKQVLIIIGTFIIAVGVALGLIMLARYLIQDIFHLHGWVKTVSQYTAVILSLFPAQYLFSSTLLKFSEEATEK